MRAGISGPRRLGDPAARDWIANSLARLLDQHAVTEGLSTLAEGADQLFAELILATARKLVAVIPCANYQAAFDTDAGRAAYLRLSDRAHRRVQLDFRAPGERAFLDAGRHVVEHCDVLFAVRDGKPARGMGGTAEIVELARRLGRRTIQLDALERKIR